jgi:hypothetical protein
MEHTAKLVKTFKNFLSYCETLKRNLEEKDVEGALSHCSLLLGELRVMDFFIEEVPELEKLHRIFIDKMTTVCQIMDNVYKKKWDAALALHPKLLDPPPEQNSVYEQPKRRYLSGTEIVSILSTFTPNIPRNKEGVARNQ